MFEELIRSKRCILVCGGGGVGKTTVSASLALSATRIRARVLVLTIDPSKRLLQAFGYPDALLSQGGAPLLLPREKADLLQVPPDAELSIAVLNPRRVIDEVIDQTLTPTQAVRLRATVLYREMTQMIHGLQEYTAYEWVTRLISEDCYDLIVLDTPPAFHAKEFFNAPEKIRNLMESRVFQIFIPKSGGWFKSILSTSWIEKLLGEGLFRESTMFFETFAMLRDRILERCARLARFFKETSVGVIAVGTPESAPLLELEGLSEFLHSKEIPLQGIILNQVEEDSTSPSDEWAEVLNPETLKKLSSLRERQNARADRAREAISRVKARHPSIPVATLGMVYDPDGFAILRANAARLAGTGSGL